eukprot:TRINITY_DN72_c0_g1_i1.p1 TRINITY_DN72_c0_g1~~TRINITY_DN72_c0_g1_i1.p1  ORF type:complete len:224 (+),score=48.34 TRINITY_DN72_c0_g1_i1:228-899(+)
MDDDNDDIIQTTSFKDMNYNADADDIEISDLREKLLKHIVRRVSTITCFVILTVVTLMFLIGSVYLLDTSITILRMVLIIIFPFSQFIMTLIALYGFFKVDKIFLFVYFIVQGVTICILGIPIGTIGYSIYIIICFTGECSLFGENAGFGTTFFWLLYSSCLYLIIPLTIGLVISSGYFSVKLHEFDKTNQKIDELLQDFGGDYSNISSEDVVLDNSDDEINY